MNASIMCCKKRDFYCIYRNDAIFFSKKENCIHREYTDAHRGRRENTTVAGTETNINRDCGGNKVKVKYWSDYACPFCYISETSLKQAITNLKKDNDAQLEMKAFELDPEGSRHYEGPTDERYSKKYGYSLEETRKSIDDINARGCFHRS